MALGLAAGLEDSASPTDGAPESHVHVHQQIVILFFFLCLVSGAASMQALSRFAPSLPYTCVLLVQGLLLGILITAHTFDVDSTFGSFVQSVKMWTHINPHVLLYTFLPALLFGDSMGLNAYMVRKCFGQCVLLAVPGVLMGTCLTAAVAKWIFPMISDEYDWNWHRCMMFGSILSATDPVAVVAILKDLGASPKLTMIIAGESLLNDGTAMVLFNLFMALAQDEETEVPGHEEAKVVIGLASGEEPTLLFCVSYFLRMAVGGALVGIAFGLLATFWIASATKRTSHSDTAVQIMVTLACAYLTFFLAEYSFGVSGVLATVFAAVVVGALASPLFNEKEAMGAVWHTIENVGNTVLFILSGLIIGRHRAERFMHKIIYIDAHDSVALIVLYVAVNAIRFIMVAMFFPFLRRMGYGLDVREGIVLSWGGLRGAVGLALALDVNLETWGQGVNNQEFSSKVLFHVSGVAVLTLLVNGMTSAGLLQKLGMTQTEVAKENLLREVRRRISSFGHSVLAAEADKIEDCSASQREAVINACGCLRDDAQASFVSEDGGGSQGLAPFRQTMEIQKIAAVRELFMKCVQGSYADQVDQGILSAAGPQEMILRLSVEFAMDHLNQGLKDLEYILRRLRTPHRNCENTLAGGVARLMEALGKHENSGVILNRKRTECYALVCFIRAHAEAQDIVCKYLCKDSEELSDVEELVISESEKLLGEAQAQLDDLDPQLVAEVTSEQMASVVLEKEHRFIQRLHSGGVIDGKQAHRLIHRVEVDTVRLRKDGCQVVREEPSDALNNTMTSIDARTSRSSWRLRPSGSRSYLAARSSLPSGLGNDTDMRASIQSFRSNSGLKTRLSGDKDSAPLQQKSSRESFRRMGSDVGTEMQPWNSGGSMKDERLLTKEAMAMTRIPSEKCVGPGCNGPHDHEQPLG